MKVTSFETSKSYGKIPYSPFDDGTFIFSTQEVEKISDVYDIMVSKFILNIPLSKQQESFRSTRRTESLKNFYGDKIDYLILDLDDVKTEDDRDNILKFLKDYRVIIGQSSSYNNITNFNLKGIIAIDPIPISESKFAVADIAISLKKFCVVDESVVRNVSYNSPIKKKHIFFNNDNGKNFKYKKINSVEQHKIPLKFENRESLKDVCLDIFGHMKFSAVKKNANGSLKFKHPDEKKTIGGYYWFEDAPFIMHHANISKTINIYDTLRKIDSIKNLLNKDLNYDDLFLNFSTDTSVITVNQKYLSVTKPVHDSVKEFLYSDSGLFYIRSPMGTGKSIIIKHIIEEAHKQKHRVLIVTNRISVANDFGEKYSIKIYNQDKYFTGDSLICQFDSLWNYNINNFDIIVFDEFISLMLHSRSNITNNTFNNVKFFACFNKKLVIADAFLTGYENFLLSSKTKNIHLLDNEYRDQTVLYDYENFNFFVNTLLLHAEKHKVTVSSTSINFIESLSLLLTSKGRNVITLTAETPDNTKQLIYELFKENKNDKWDILIFSPTLTVGVSNLNDLDYHFHYDSSMSTDVISSIQMIKRSRKSKEIHFYIKDRINFVKTDYEDLREEYMKNIGNHIRDNYLFEIDDYGDMRLSEIGKKCIKIDTFKNILYYNTKKAFKWMLQYQFLTEPRIIETKFGSNILNKYKIEIKNTKNTITQNKIDQFLLLNDIDQIEISEIGDKTNRIIAETNFQINPGTPSHVKKSIIELTSKKPDFIKICQNYNILLEYKNKDMTDEDLKRYISETIMRKENHDVGFFHELLKINPDEIKSEYVPKEIVKIKRVLDKCGFKLQNKYVGRKVYTPSKEVLDFHRYIRKLK